jgi:predicted DNA-binding WGR domain protein
MTTKKVALKDEVSLPKVKRPYALLTRLVFTDYNANSDKFHDSVLAGTEVFYRFGRRGTNGQVGSKSFETPEKAAAYYWGLLRDKIGKTGYHVDSAKVLPISDLFISSQGYGIRDVDWDKIAWGLAQTIGHPELLGHSDRTPKQGAQVFLTLTSAKPDEDELVNCALASESERFLLPMVLSHPACPEEAAVIATLMKTESWMTVQ